MSEAVDQPGADRSDELRAVLTSELKKHFDAPLSITGLSHRPSSYQSSFAVEEIDVSLSDDTCLNLFFKDLSWQSLSEVVRGAKPAFLYNPLTEIEVYRTVLDSKTLATPTYYGSIVDPQQDRYWLFMERVSGLKLRHIGLFEVWRQVARYLARMHAHFAADLEPNRLEAIVHLPRYSSDYYRLWMHRAQAHLGQAEITSPPRTSSPRTSSGIDWLAGRYDKVVERLQSLPHGLIHGEFYAGNIIVDENGRQESDKQRGSEKLRICPIDWETASIGPSLIDLAALTSGSWTEAQRVELSLDYYDEMASSGRLLPSREDFLRDIEYCRLHLAVQWLGWSTTWSPPAEEEYNWLGEALRIAETIDL